jgi:hypothetical protein
MPHPSRRTLLVAGTVGLGLGLVGCSTTTLPVIGRPDPDQDQRRQTAQSEQALISLYAAVISAIPSLSDELAEFQNQHAQHLKAVSFDLGDPLASASAPSPPANRKVALNQLRRAERLAAKARTSASVSSEDSTLAELLARIGTSESAHAAFLIGVH